jgi:hypothetical protein
MVTIVTACIKGFKQSILVLCIRSRTLKFSNKALRTFMDHTIESLILHCNNIYEKSECSMYLLYYLIWIEILEDVTDTLMYTYCVRSRKLSNIGRSSDGWPKIYYLELLHASEDTLNRWSRLYLHSLAPTYPHWACVVGYGSFSLWVIHEEGLCPSNGGIHKLMMMMMMNNAS